MPTPSGPFDAVFHTGPMAPSDWLLCDADDTLWENNIHFEQVIKEFIEYVEHPFLSPFDVRACLDEIEMRNVKVHGYGVKNFTRNLKECYETVKSRTADDEEIAQLRDMTVKIVEGDVEVIPGVAETLRELATRYRLALITKGDQSEQLRKLARSGLGRWFTFVKTVPEKDADCYRTVVCALQADPSRTWMIGNSPKSDINPALAAGLGAVLVPNDNTWRLEVQDIPRDHERFRAVDRFSDLTSIF